MDQLVAGVAIAAQQTIHRELPAGFAGVIIGDDDLLIFAACRLGHAVGTGGAEDIAILIELADVVLVVVGNDEVSFTGDQYIMEPLMILRGKLHLVAALRLVVGRVTVDHGACPVVLTDDLLEVLVLHNDIRQPAGAFPDQVKETADVAGLAAEGLGAAAEAVADELEEVRRASDAPAGRALQHKGADGLGVGRLEVDLRQIHLLLQVVIRELTSGEELVKDVEVIPRVQRQEAKLRQQCHGAVLHAAEQVGEIAVEVVVDFHAAALDGTAHGHRAAAAKHIDEAGVAVRHQLVDDPQQLALAAYPGNKAVQEESPPSSGRES